MKTRRGGSRNLSAEEKALWDRAVEKTDRLRNPAKILMEHLEPVASRTPVPPEPFKSFRLGEKARKPAAAVNLLPALDESFAKVSSNMDKRNFERLKKGKLSVEGRMDLHGMTLAQAHPALNRFVQESYHSGKRLLLVITGKGNAAQSQSIMPERRGVLRHQVPQWLSMAPLSPLVLQVTQASKKHGGSGAYYVYLRRQR